MKSIKPGRGPSLKGAIIGIAVALFGVFWTVMAAVMGAWFMIPFGLIFIGIAVVNIIYDLKNATGKNRYSEYDITDENEEPDPFNERFGNMNQTEIRKQSGRFCPYCGAKNEDNYKFCTECGEKLP